MTRAAFGVLATVVVVASFVGGRLSASPPPGKEAFVPTKVEWAALQLSARYGSATGGFALQFVSATDGVTIEANLTWVRSKEDLSRVMVRKFVRDRFQEYRETASWPWLRLRIIEVDRSGPLGSGAAPTASPGETP